MPNAALAAVDVENLAQGNEEVVTELEKLIIYVEAIVSRLALEDIAAMTDEIRAAKSRLSRLLIEAYRNDRSDLKG